MVKMPPRIVLTGLRGGSGKTFVTVGLTSLLHERGYSVSPFKKGPDFIDPAWITLSSGTQCYNLDMFLMTRDQIIGSFITHASSADIAVIEGNRGLYDGLDIEGSCSSVELAKTLGAPVILVIDVTMSTRTVAAIVKGCQVFDEGVRIGGVIINRVAGPRQRGLIINSIERYCDIPVIGYIPRVKDNPFPERHMGLVPFQERENVDRAIDCARALVSESIDLDKLWEIARTSGEIGEGPHLNDEEQSSAGIERNVRIGVIRDQSFWFYYPENLDGLIAAGAELVEINSITDTELPDIDGLYIGGGFPETQADVLAANVRFRDSVRRRIDEGLPVYAECGGLLYLGTGIIIGNSEYPMVGALPVRFVMEKKPQGHGYTVLETSRSNPFFTMGQIFRGHEFHYSRVLMNEDSQVDMAFTVHRGKGIYDKKDGFVKNNLLATYSHVHATGEPRWAECFVRRVQEVKKLHKKKAHTRGAL